MRQFAPILIAIVLALVACDNDQQNIQPASTDTTTTTITYSDTVYVLWPDTLYYRGKSWTVNRYDAHSVTLSYYKRPETERDNIYHGFEMVRDTLEGIPCWREKTGEPWLWGHVVFKPTRVYTPGLGEWGMRVMYYVTGATPADSGSATIIRKTGGRP